MLFRILFIAVLFPFLGPLSAHAETSGRLVIHRNAATGTVNTISFPGGQTIYYQYDDQARLTEKRFSGFMQQGLDEGVSAQNSISCFGNESSSLSLPFCHAILDEISSPVSRLPSFRDLFDRFFAPTTLARFLKERRLPRNLPPSWEERSRLYGFSALMLLWRAATRKNLSTDETRERFATITGLPASFLDALPYSQRIEAQQIDSLFHDLDFQMDQDLEKTDGRIVLSVEELRDYAPLENLLAPTRICAPWLTNSIRDLYQDNRVVVFHDEAAAQTLLSGSLPRLFGVEWSLPSIADKIAARKEGLEWNQKTSNWFLHMLENWRLDFSGHNKSLHAFLQQYTGDVRFEFRSIGDENFPWGSYALAHELAHVLQALRIPRLSEHAKDVRTAIPFTLARKGSLERDFGRFLESELIEPFGRYTESGATDFALDLLAPCMTAPRKR